MTRLRGTSLAAVAVLLSLPGRASAQAGHYPLENTQGLRLVNVSAEPVTLQGRKGVKLTLSPEAARRVTALPPDQRDVEQLAVLEGELARGFVGIAFRLQDDRTYDAFYLRPTNGRAEDQERRNHSAQYISHPEWTWFRLRKETPSRYESYVDLVPGEWAKVRIEVRGDHARLFVNDAPQPTLVVNDVKTGASAKGGVALWLGPGTVAHFRNLTVTPAP